MRDARELVGDAAGVADLPHVVGGGDDQRGAEGDRAGVGHFDLDGGFAGSGDLDALDALADADATERTFDALVESSDLKEI